MYCLNEESFISSDKMFSWWVDCADRTRSDIKFSKISFSTRLGIIIKKHDLKGIICAAKRGDGKNRGYNVCKEGLDLYITKALK